MPVKIEDEKAVIAKHSEMIEELIIPTMRGQLDVELATLSSLIPAAELDVVKRELNRLCLPCQEDIDLSEHTSFTIEPFNFGHCVITVCKVGRRLFRDQLKRYDGRYTRGVFEAVNEPAAFERYMAAHRVEWKKKAFTVPASRLHSPIKPSDLKLAPNLTLTLPTADGEEVKAKCFSMTPYELVLESGEELPTAKGEVCNVEFPGLPGYSFTPQQVNYQTLSVQQDEARGTYLTRLGILKKEARWADTVKDYIEKFGHKLPAILPQETVRTDIDLAKVQLMASSEWIPVFCTLSRGQLHPLDVLYTEGNEKEIAALSLNQEFIFSGSWMGRLSNELLTHSETDLLWLRKGGDTFVCTLREAAKDEEFASFINQESLRGDLQVLKCRLVKLTKQDHAVVRREIAGAGDLLGNHINSILYIKDMTALHRRLVLNYFEKPSPPPIKYLQSDASAKPVQLLMSKQSERRQESRYRFGCKVSLRSGLLKTMDGTLVDFSLGGMKVQLNEPLADPRLQSVYVNIDAFRLRKAKMGGIKFQVLDYHPAQRCLRLQVNDKHKPAFKKHMSKLFEHNAPVFAERDIHVGLRVRYDALYALASLRHPGIYVRLKNSRFESERLFQALVGEPFSDGALLQAKGDDGVMLYKLFADKNAESPTSELLSKLFHSKHKSRLCLFSVCLKTKKISQVDLKLMDDHRRQQLITASGKSIRLVGLWMAVKPLNAIPADTLSSVMQRMSQINSEEADKAKKEMLSVKEVLTLTDVSPLVHCFLHMGNLTDDIDEGEQELLTQAQF